MDGLIKVLQEVGSTYALMDTPSIESLHGAFSSTRIVVLDEAVIETFTLELMRNDDLVLDLGEA